MGKARKKNCHKSIYRKDIGKPRHGGGKMADIELQGQDQLYYILWNLSRISRYIAGTSDQAAIFNTQTNL